MARVYQKWIIPTSGKRTNLLDEKNTTSLGLQDSLQYCVPKEIGSSAGKGILTRQKGDYRAGKWGEEIKLQGGLSG